MGLLALACATKVVDGSGSPTGSRGAEGNLPADGDASAADPDATPADPSSDGAASSNDAAPDAAGVIEGCTLKRASASADCTDDCAAHLRLPAPNDWYCTQACDKPSDCAGAPSTTCAPYGACVPRCSADAQCRALGFARCDLSAGACDTI